MNVDLYKYTSIEFALFREFAEFLTTLKYYPKGDRADINADDMYKYLAGILGINSWRTVQTAFNMRKEIGSFPVDGFKIFCDTFIEVFEKLDSSLKEKYSAINDSFWSWRKNIYQREGWPDKYKNVEFGEAVLNKDASLDKDILEVKNLLARYLSGSMNLDEYWDSISFVKKSRYGSKEKLSVHRKSIFRNFFPVSFTRISDSLIDCRFFAESKVNTHISYSIFLQELKGYGMDYELLLHEIDLMRFFDAGIRARPETEEEREAWFIGSEEEKYISVEKIFELFGLDHLIVDEILPLLKNAYIKSSFRCVFCYEYEGWKVHDVKSRFEMTYTPASYPQYFIRVQKNQAFKEKLDFL